MNRRQLLIYSGGAVAVLGGGWLAYDQLAGTSGPDGRAQAFVQALDEGDTERANEMVHSDASQNEVPDYTARPYRIYDVAVESSEIIEETDERATVELTLSYTGPSGENTETQTVDVELSKEDGSWKIDNPSL